MRIIGNISGVGSRHKGFFLLGLCAAAGIIAGSVMEAKNMEAVSSPWVHQFFSPISGGDGFLESVGNSCLSSAIFLAAVFFTGLFVFGQPFGIVLLIWRGIGIGASVAGMYGLCGAEAIPAVIMLVLPKALVSVIIAVLAVRELIRSSNMLLSFTAVGEIRENRRSGIRLYCIKFLVLLLISVIVCIAGSAVNILLH